MNVEIRGLEMLVKGIEERQDLEPIKNLVRLNGAELMEKMVRNAEFKKGYQKGQQSAA